MTTRQDILDHVQGVIAEIEDFDGRAFFVNQDGNDMTVLPAAVIGWTDDRVEFGPANGRFSRFLQVFVVICARQGEEGMLPLVDDLVAAVEQAIAADPTQGGNAYTTDSIAAELRPAVEGYPDAVAGVSFTVNYFVQSLGPV